MDKNKINRNRPSETGSNNDPELRDETASQPGISTISSAENDGANNSLTETASDDFEESEFGEGADEAFDERRSDDNK